MLELISYNVVSDGSIKPLGRLTFVKFANPDMYPGHPHSQLLSEYAEAHSSKYALVVHFAGSSNYRSYPEFDENESEKDCISHCEGNNYIIALDFINTQGNGAAAPINWTDSLKWHYLEFPR